MMTYFSHGRRDYRAVPVAVNARPCWEFQAVLKGALAPQFPEQQPPAYSQRTLWVFPPGIPHGWLTPPGRTCEIVVLHYDAVPDVLARACRETGTIRQPLSASDCGTLARMTRELSEHHPRLTELTPLLAERSLYELSLIAMRDRPIRPVHTQQRYAEQKVAQALNWFAEHMSMRAGVNEVARAAGVSAVQLRRLFHASGHEPPLQHLTHMRISRAQKLLRETDLPIEKIARLIGLSGPTVFCRQFRQATGLSPGAWRQRHQHRATVPATRPEP